MMRTFNSYFKKEIMESLRQYRYITLGVGILVFAILDPLMLKLLPTILKDQIPGDVSSLFNVTPSYAVINYIKDLVNIGNLFVIFTLGGILSEEIHSQKLVFPYSSGSKPSGIVLAKVIHYILVVTIFTFLGFLIAYYYIGILIKGDMPTFTGVMKSATLLSFYFGFNISLVVFLSSFVKKGIAASFIVLLSNFVAMGAVKLKVIGKYMPYKLIEKANLMSFEDAGITISFICIVSMIFILITILRMSKVEVI